MSDLVEYFMVKIAPYIKKKDVELHGKDGKFYEILCTREARA